MRKVLHAVALALGWLLILPIRLYQQVISPMTPPTCRYYPSCSSYAIEAVTVHGPAKGPVLAGWRLLRCNPWSDGGLDPVPSKGSWRPEILPDGTPRSTTVDNPHLA